MKGQYVVYERAARVEERFFLDIAKEVVDGVEEPRSWKKESKPGRHQGGIREEGRVSMGSGPCSSS